MGQDREGQGISLQLSDICNETTLTLCKAQKLLNMSPCSGSWVVPHIQELPVGD